MYSPTYAVSCVRVYRRGYSLLPDAHLYRHSIADGASDGQLALLTDVWSSGGATGVALWGGGFGTLPGLSFPAVDVAGGTVITSATLTMEITAVSNDTENMQVRVATPQASSARWSSSLKPNDLAVLATATFGTPSVGVHEYDITTEVQAALDHADWEAGDWLLLSLRPSGDVGHYTYAMSEHAAARAPELVIA